jgi:hypothetical protein
MSQPASPRSQTSTAGMVGAMIVVVLLALGWVGFRQLTGDDKTAPVQTVDWAAWVKAGRTDHQLLVFAPTALPSGWRATSVEYTGGHDAYWHLGLLTDVGKYVGIDESRNSVDELAKQYVDTDAVRGKDVTVAGQTWQTWTDSGGDYALARSVEVGGAPYESVLAGGSADPAAVREFVATLTSGEVHLAG